jgi:hypothetical protein
MTLDQIETACREQHNAVGDSNWGQQEIYTLITKRCNQVLSIIGLIEDYATATSVASQQAYSLNSDFVDTSTVAAKVVSIRDIEYKYDRLKQINFREWDLYRSDSGTPEGTPDKYFKWGQSVYLVPTPSTGGDTIRLWFYKWHPYIDNSTQTTVDIPEELHDAVIDGVIGDMFVKDLNVQMARFFEEKWLNIHVPRMYKWKHANDRGSGFKTVGDADTLTGTELGVA